MPPSSRDIDLIARANRGDTAAWEELYDEYRHFVFHMAHRRLDNTDDALEVTQETFMYLFARFPGFELTAAMTTFLYPVVDHLCRDRRLRRRPMVDIDALGDATDALAAASDSDVECVNLLSRLNPEQRELLTLRFVEDLSLSQLAEVLGAPVGTVKIRLHRAIGALRDKARLPARRRA